MPVTNEDGHRLISNSEIQTFKRCPRKWWLAWYRGLAPRREVLTGVRNIGTRGHAALAEYYGPDRVHPVEAHQKIKSDDRAKAVSLGYSEFEMSALEKDFTMESAMLSGYMEWLAETGEDQFIQPDGAEVYLEADLTVEAEEYFNHVKIIGKLDAPVTDTRTGARKFIDHKFVGSLNVTGLRQNPQMLHYHLLQWLNTPEGGARCEGAYYNMLKRSKRTQRATPPFYARKMIPHNKAELTSYKAQLEVSIERMLETETLVAFGESRPGYFAPATALAYPNRRDDCEWSCDFVSICPLFDDGSRVEDAVQDRYTERDPLSYYQGKEKG